MNFSPKKSGPALAESSAPRESTAAAADATPAAPSSAISASIPGVRAKASEQQRGEIDALRQLVAMDEKDPDRWDRLGKALYLVGDYEEAVKCFRQSLQLKPGMQEVVANLGVTLKTKGDMAQYQQVLDQLTALNPQMGEDLKNFKPAAPAIRP